MRDNDNEAKRLWIETYPVKDQIDYVAVDPKAHDSNLFRKLERQRKIN
jgi:hypothetical protein